ncbi:hypothetical protein CBM2626_B130102 [Cupriavidus taiwanensis]|nr:hypothetical protein CBM2626_B130102 [Cupriavidus taiwanensis]
MRRRLAGAGRRRHAPAPGHHRDAVVPRHAGLRQRRHRDGDPAPLAAGAAPRRGRCADRAGARSAHLYRQACRLCHARLRRLRARTARRLNLPFTLAAPSPSNLAKERQIDPDHPNR